MREARFSFNRGGILNRLRSAAIIAFWLHLLAGASMALVLRRGLETNPNFQDRLAFIVNQRALWIAGWLTWTAAAIAADLSGQAIEIGVLPGLAARVDFFTAFHRTAVMMSGYVANGMYSLSALVLSWSTRRSYPEIGRHTSELQSRLHLVCRLLLARKK